MKLLDFPGGRIFRFGSDWSPIHVVAGRDAAIIDGGLLGGYPDVAESILRLSRDYPIRYWLVTHAHFDHCGLLPYLRDHLPGCRICASEKAAQILDRPGTSAFIDKMNQAAVPKAGEASLAEQRSVRGYAVDQVVRHGDVLDLGHGVACHILDAPGHSPCGIAVWLARAQALFAADALGACRNPAAVFPLIFHSALAYRETISTLSGLEPEWVIPGHYAPLSQTQAHQVCVQAAKGIDDFQKTFGALQARLGQEQAARIVAEQHYEHLAGGLFSLEAFTKSILAMWHILQEEQ